MPWLACPRFAQAAQPGVKGRNLIGTICSVPAAALEDDIVAPPGNVYLSGGCLVEDEAAASARTSASCNLQGVTFKVFTMSESQRRGSVSAILRTLWYSQTRPSTYCAHRSPQISPTKALESNVSATLNVLLLDDLLPEFVQRWSRTSSTKLLYTVLLDLAQSK